MPERRDSPKYVWEALDLLKVNRIDHGNRSLEDATLVQRLCNQRMPLTLCPLSNLKLRVVDDLHNHPLSKMLDLGLRVTINSDDPSYFGGYMNENFVQITEALGLEESHLLSQHASPKLCPLVQGFSCYTGILSSHS